jgi:hypothetical protein
MDAMTLFVIVTLANGEVRTVDKYPAILTREPCHVVARKMPHGDAHNWYLRAGAKQVMFYCAPTEKPLVIAR